VLVFEDDRTSCWCWKREVKGSLEGRQEGTAM
jgi:hypothetical protein